jgi:hypothetical protein
MKKPVLKVGKKFTLNGWMIFDGLALVIIVGVLAARFAGASVESTFKRTPDQMSGGTLSRSVANGISRHIVAEGIHAETSVTVTAQELATSRQVCAQMKVNSAETFIDIQVNGKYANKFVTTPGEALVCVDLKGEQSDVTVYAGTSGDVNVSVIYGVQ